LVYYRPPHSVRLDDGVREGDVISTFYDPMVGKLITYGKNRNEARLKMIKALNDFYISGLSTNIPFLNALCQLPAFITGDAHTHTIGDVFPEGYKEPSFENPHVPAVVAAVLNYLTGCDGDHGVALLGCDEYALTIEEDGQQYTVSTDAGTWIIETSWRPVQPLFECLMNGEPLTFQVECIEGLSWVISSGGSKSAVRILPPHVAELAHKMPPKIAKDTSRLVCSPMPGLVVQLHAKVGQSVKIGDPIAVIEAMKMENVIRAAKDGIIESLHIHAGDSVFVDQKLAEIA